MKRVVVNMSTSRKERFKLYKAKKRWLIAGLAFAGAAMMTGGQVSANQVSDTQATAIETKSDQPDASKANGAVVTSTSATLTTDTDTQTVNQSTPAPVTTDATTTSDEATPTVSEKQPVVETPATQQQTATQAPVQLAAKNTDASQDTAQQEQAAPATDVKSTDENEARTWDYVTDADVQATVGATINGALDASGKEITDGGDFTQTNKANTARVVNGYSVTVSIDNTTGKYHKGDTIQIPIYGEMASNNTAVDPQRFDVVSAKGTLLNGTKTIGSYVVNSGFLGITLTDELVGNSESTLNITGTDASPVASTAIWFNEKGTATLHFGKSQVAGTVTFVAGTSKGVDEPNTTQWVYSKSDNIGVESFFQDNKYLNAIYNGDVKTAEADENGQFGTDDLVQIQRITINSGTVKAVTSNRTYSNFWVPKVSGNGFIATSVTAAAITLGKDEQEVQANFNTQGIDYGVLEGEVAKSLKAAGLGAYTIIKIDEKNYLVAYNIGNPYQDYSTESLSNNPKNDFSDFLASGKNQGDLTTEQLAKLQSNIDYATAGKKSVGAGSVVHIFDVAFADNGTQNSLDSTLDTYDVNGKKLHSTGTTNIKPTPDSQNFKGQAQLKVLYVDEQGKALAPAVARLSKPGTLYAESAITIPGYTLNHVNGAAQGVYSGPNTTNSVVFVYAANEQKAVVNFVDQTDNNKTLESANLTGKSNTKDDYTPAEKIAYYVSKGYEFVSSDFPENGLVYDTDDAETQTYTVVLKHKMTTVTPDEPEKPGQPVNPSNPEGPKWPTENDLNKKVTETINYVDDDEHKTVAAKSVTDEVSFSRTAIVDEATGAVTYGDWKAKDNDTTFETKVSPVITGYIADKANVAEVDGLTPASANVEETVIYSKLGSYVPELPDGSTPSVPYPNDPTDPSKPGTDGPAMPYVSGYTPEGPDGTPLTPVDPEDPSKGYSPPAVPDDQKTDTVIKYNGDNQNVVYNVINDTTGENVATKVVFESGKTGAPLSKGQSDLQAIADAYTKQVYDVVSVDTLPTTFDNDDKVDQVVNIHLKNKTATDMVPNDPIYVATSMVPNDPIRVATDMVPNDPIYVATSMVPNDPIRVATDMVPNDPIYVSSAVVPNDPITVPASGVTGDDTAHVQKVTSNDTTEQKAAGDTTVVNRINDHTDAKSLVADSNAVSLPDTAAKGDQDKNALLVAFAVMASLLTFGFVQKRK